MIRFHSSGGTLLYRTTPLTRADGVWMFNLYRDEHEAALNAGDARSANRIYDLACELSAAISVADQWVRASGSVRS